MEEKHILLSKQFWNYIIGAVAAIATAKGFHVEWMTPENQATAITAITTVVGVVLRATSSSAVTVLPK